MSAPRASPLGRHARAEEGRRGRWPNFWLVGLDLFRRGPSARDHRLEAGLRDSDAAWLRLHYQASGDSVDYRIRLATTRPQ
jgi:hypothetical protein